MKKSLEEMLNIFDKALICCFEYDDINYNRYDGEGIVYISQTPKLYLRIYQNTTHINEEIESTNIFGRTTKKIKRTPVACYTLCLHWKRDILHTLVSMNPQQGEELLAKLKSRKDKIMRFEVDRILAEKLDMGTLSYSEFLTGYSLRNKEEMKSLTTEIELFYHRNHNV